MVALKTWKALYNRLFHVFALLRTNTYTYTYYFRRRKQDKKYTFVVLRFTFDLIATVAFLQGVSKRGKSEIFY